MRIRIDSFVTGYHPLSEFIHKLMAIEGTKQGLRKTNPVIRLAAFSARVLPLGVKQAIYRNRFLSGLIRSTLNQAAPDDLVTVQIAGGMLKGSILVLNLQNEKDYWLGTYEPELLQAIQDWVKPGMVAYDVGANIGYISLALAKIIGSTGQVFSFEALPANVERLRISIKLNNFADQVNVIEVAIVDFPGPHHFLLGPSGGMGKASGSAGRQADWYEQEIVVKGTSLDSFVFEQGNPPPHVVKMDIEGGEVLALPGMKKILETFAPLIFLELHGPESAQVAWDILRENNYRLFNMRSGYPEVKSMHEFGWKEYLVGRPDHEG